MAALIFPSRWVEKPPLGSYVDPGHPLARDLGACWLLNDYGAVSVKSCFDGGVPAAEAFGTLTNAPVYQPRGMKFTAASSQRLAFPTQTRLATAQANYSMTYAAGICRTSLPASGQCIMGSGGSGAGASSRCIFNINGANLLLNDRDDAAVNSSITATLPAQDDRVVVSCSNYSSSLRKIFLRGLESASGTTALGTRTTSTFDIGAWRDNGTAVQFFDQQIEWVMVWLRALTPEEHLELAVAPFGMFTQAPRLRWGHAVAAGASSPVYLSMRTLLGVGR